MIIKGVVIALTLCLTLEMPIAEVDDSTVTVAYADAFVGTDGQFQGWENLYEAQSFRAKLDQYRAWRHDYPRHKGDR